MFKRFDKHALHSAVFEGDFSLVKELLAKRASYSVCDDNGATPMHVAAMHGNFKILHLLRVHGAKFDDADSHGETPLHLAVKAGDLESVKEIISTSPKLDIQDRFGNTALHYSVEYGNEEIVQYLLKSGARPNYLNENHESPLSIAERDSKDDLQKLLLKYKAKKPMHFFKALMRSFRIANFLRKSLILVVGLSFILSLLISTKNYGLAFLPVFLCMLGILLGVTLVLLDRPYKIVKKIEEKLFNGHITNYEYESLLDGKVIGSINNSNEEIFDEDSPKIVFIEQSTKCH